MRRRTTSAATTPDRKPGRRKRRERPGATGGPRAFGDAVQPVLVRVSRRRPVGHCPGLNPGSVSQRLCGGPWSRYDLSSRASCDVGCRYIVIVSREGRASDGGSSVGSQRATSGGSFGMFGCGGDMLGELRRGCRPCPAHTGTAAAVRGSGSSADGGAGPGHWGGGFVGSRGGWWPGPPPGQARRGPRGAEGEPRRRAGRDPGPAAGRPAQRLPDHVRDRGAQRRGLAAESGRCLPGAVRSSPTRA